jgi:hypothetical protein
MHPYGRRLGTRRPLFEPSGDDHFGVFADRGPPSVFDGMIVTFPGEHVWFSSAGSTLPAGTEWPTSTMLK